MYGLLCVQQALALSPVVLQVVAHLVHAGDVLAVDVIVKLVRKAFAKGGMDLDGDTTPYVGTKSKVKIARTASFNKFNKVTEQANLVIGVPGIDRNDVRRFQMTVLNAALGGGMSSRLFQEVREKRGLVYSTYSFSQQYADTGVVGVYAGCQPKRLDAVREVMSDVLADIAANGITQEELERAKGQVTGGTVLGLEDTSSRMSRIARNEMNNGFVPSVSDILDEVNAVTLDQVRTLAHHVWSQEMQTVVVGPE